MAPHPSTTPALTPPSPLLDVALILGGLPALAVLVKATVIMAGTADVRVESLIAALIAGASAGLLAWHLTWSLLAHLSVSAPLPTRIRSFLYLLIQRAGTSRARMILARAGVVATVGSACVLGSVAAHGSPGISDDLSWGAPGQSTPSAVSTPSSSPSALPSAHESAAPETTTTTADDRTASSHVHIVTSGESLWTITASTLGPTASNADIAQWWPRLYELNQIGRAHD